MLLKNKKRIIVAIMALIIVAIVLVLIFKPQKAVSDDIYSNRDSKFEKLAKIEKQENILEKNLDEGSIYSRYYSGVKEYEMGGYSRSEAEKATQDAVIEKEAVYQKAVEEGYEISPTELKKKMLEEYTGMKEAEEYKEIVAAYKEQGLSFEKEYFGDSEMYKKQWTIEKLYNSELEKISKGEDINENQHATVDERWDAYEDEIINDYKKTNDYRILKKGLDTAKKNMRAYGHNVKQIKKNNIDVYDKIEN